MNNELLPVGSVVETKDKSYMILGYFPNHPNDKEQYDYVCGKKRIGISKNIDEIKLNKDIFYLKKEDIVRVVFIGYNDEEFDTYSSLLSEFAQKINDGKKNNKEYKVDEVKKIFDDIVNKKIKNQKGDKDEE